jgi:outer membrane protein assembly factor BamE (lipoprotein component of BamABCDE complex)
MFSRLRRGMTQDEVLPLIGAPDETMKFPNGNVSWDYRYQDTWGYMARFSVTFSPAGQVVDTVSVRLNDGGDSKRR